MQIKGKLTNKIWENGRKNNFGPAFGPFWPILGPQIVFRKFLLYYVLYIVASYPVM